MRGEEREQHTFCGLNMKTNRGRCKRGINKGTRHLQTQSFRFCVASFRLIGCAQPPRAALLFQRQARPALPASRVPVVPSKHTDFRGDRDRSLTLCRSQQLDVPSRCSFLHHGSIQDSLLFCFFLFFYVSCWIK